MHTQESILQEAHRLTHGDRQVQYGPPYEDYARNAALVNALLGHKLKEPLSAGDIALVMCCVKLSRQVNSPKRDNMTDLAGYAWVAHECYAHEISAKLDRDGADADPSFLPDHSPRPATCETHGRTICRVCNFP